MLDITKETNEYHKNGFVETIRNLFAQEQEIQNKIHIVNVMNVVDSFEALINTDTYGAKSIKLFFQHEDLHFSFSRNEDEPLSMYDADKLYKWFMNIRKYLDDHKFFYSENLVENGETFLLKIEELPRIKKALLNSELYAIVEKMELEKELGQTSQNPNNQRNNLFKL